MAAPQASSRLEMLQARFQQRQLLEKEQKLLQLYDQQQLRAHQVAQRGSAGSNGSNSSSHGSHHQTTVTRTSTSTHSTSNSQGGGKVRQMFDERRQTTVKGIDKSYPLEPLDGRSRKHQISTSNVVVTSTTSPQKNGNPGSNRIVTRKTVRSEANSDVNNGKPVVTYREEVSREIGDTIDRDYDQDEFGDENLRVSQYGNDDRPSDLDFESVANENASQSHRTTAKIHLSEFDPSNGNDRATDNLEDERFPGDRSIDMPERLQRRGSATKRTSEAETRFERFKNSNAKKISQPIKQVAGNTTSFTKKRNESTVHSGTSSRVAKSPSPDIGTKRTMEGRARTTTATTTTVRRSVPSSPAKSPDTTNRYGSSELRISTAKSSTKPSSSPGSREIRNQTEYSTTSEYTDRTDNPADDSEVTVTEFVSAVTTMKNNEAFAIEPEDDDELSRGKDNALSYRGKPPLRKKSSERSLTSQRQQRSPSATPLPRPTSALSTASSGSSARASHQTLQINSKSKMSTKTKSSTSGGQKGPATPGSRGGVTSAVNDGLAPCKICGRRFNSERVTLHEQICSKTATKKRKQFDATIHRVKGTELESFVIKKSVTKKPAERKAQKPEIKSNWRRKHEDFINAIRSAKQVQAHLAAGGKLSDLPPPPPSDTSDYIQCPHCGRKFNQAAAERHIPKCQTMMHNKPNSRAPPKPKR